MTVGLVIVDMQPGFGEAVNLARKATLHEIKLAMDKNVPISIVELNSDHFGPTCGEIRNLLKDYKFYEINEKTDQEDGSIEASSYFNKINFVPKVIRICGVYTCACVSSTAIGLTKIYQDAEIIMVKKGCSSRDDNVVTQHGPPDVLCNPWNWVTQYPKIKISYKSKLIKYRKAS